MNEFTEVREGVRKEQTPRTEFVRWLIVICAAVVIETGIALFVFDWVPLLGFSLLWTIGATAEGWIQFDSWYRRAAWMFAGLLTGGCIYLQEPTVNGFPLLSQPSASLFLFAPALVEFFAARGVRLRSWIWLTATPAVYWRWEDWAGAVFNLGDRMVATLISTVGIQVNIPTSIPGIAAVIGLALIVRAFIGAFVALRKPCE